jgi:hypothetical protein
LKKNSKTSDWKVELRRGRLKTPYRHFTAIAEGIAGELSQGYTCRPGRAFMVMKIWASSPDESIDMVRAKSGQIGFAPMGHIHVFGSEPELPPRDYPYLYDIDFTPFLNPENK